MNKINKVLKFNEGEIYKNKSFRNTLNIFKQEEYVEKIKVNKNVYINSFFLIILNFFFLIIK